MVCEWNELHHLVPGKSCTRLTDTRASFLYKMTCTSFWYTFFEWQKTSGMANCGPTGCLQLLEILEISLNLYGPPGNFV